MKVPPGKAANFLFCSLRGLAAIGAERHDGAQGGTMRIALLMLALFAGAYVWVSGGSLPNMVASHFGPSGTANGFMARASYVHFMLVLIVALPVSLGLLPGLLLGLPGIRINLPNRDYWLAPSRRAATIAALQLQLTGFAILLLLFLTYIHWLTVRANQMTPPALPSDWFIGGLVTFVISLAVWLGAMMWRFRLPAD
jgi:hypothetical protein